MSTFSLSVEQHIGIVTFNKPPVNAFNRQAYAEMKEMFESINARDDIWVVLLRAEGKHFSTGNDVNEFLDLTTSKQAQMYAQGVSDGVAAVYNCRVPVIAAVNGSALGAGLALASCCDVIVAADNARFGLPEIRVSIVGAACFIARMVPQHLHRYLAFSGDVLTASEMKQFGAVLKVVPQAELWAAALAVAQRLAAMPPLCLRGFKAAMNENENAALPAQYAVELSHGAALIDSHDFKEAVTSMLEKRQPVFHGR